VVGLLNRDRADAVMDAEGIDVLVASSPENVEYASSFHSQDLWIMPAGHAFAIVPRDHNLPITLVVGRSDLDLVAAHGSTAERVVTWGSFFVGRAEDAVLGDVEQRLLALREAEAFRDPVSAVRAALQDVDLSGACIALDDYGMRPALREELKLQLSEARLVDGYAALQRIRMVKTPEEVNRLERAAEIAEHALFAAVAAFRDGISEHDLEAVYQREVLAVGARNTFGHLLIGEHGALSNGRASDRALHRGETVRFDLGCSYQSYTSDIARTATFGEPGPKLRRCYEAIQAGEEAALAMLRPGVTAGAIFAAAVEATRAAGIPQYERNHVGHGIGIEMYDPPALTPGNAALIEAGMVLNIETPYYELGWDSLAVEDTVLVTDDGYRSLTKSPRSLIEA
jgi:Xaa-Pro dipeptidase